MAEDDNKDNQSNQNGGITLEKLQEDLNQAMNGWKRTAADFENYKKRKEAENKELVEFAKEVTVARLLPILDSLEQALRHMPEYQYQVSSIMNQSHPSPTLPIKGREKVEGEASSVPLPRRPFGSELMVEEEGLGEGENDFAKRYQSWQEGINVLLKQLDKTLAEMGVKKIEALGKKFDPHFHEAVREVESDQDDQIVVEELQSGFLLNDKVIRPSQVIISKRKEI